MSVPSYAAGGVIAMSDTDCNCNTPLPCSPRLTFLGWDQPEGQLYHADHVPPFTCMTNADLDNIRANSNGYSCYTADDKYVRMTAANGNWTWRIESDPEGIINSKGEQIGWLYSLVWPD